ncbi:hypothetical protein BH11CYA1_BH11CYA1_43140 [soil metagenome]
MTTPDMLSINNVAAKLGLSVHQLRRWELMFGLEIKRGRGQQRQYRDEDLSVLERIKELVEQGWPTSQIRPQLEAEGLVSPKLIGVTPNPGNPEVLQESIIGLRNFTERRFIEISKQIDELRQLLISVTLKNELSADKASPWQPTASEYMPAPKIQPAQEITIGPQISIDPPNSNMYGSGNSGLIGRPQANPNLNANSSSSSGMQRQDARTSFEPSTGNEAVSRSMSALDSMFKERESRDADAQAQSETASASGYTKTPVIPPPDATAATAAINSLTNPASPSAPPVRHSTIPPLPTHQPPTETTEVAQTEAPTASATETENLHTDTISTPSIQSLASLTALTPPISSPTADPMLSSMSSAMSSSVSSSVPASESEQPDIAAQYSATAVDHQALDDATPTSEPLSKFTGASAFSVPPLPPNPFKTSTEGAEATQANLRSLFSPAAPEPPLGLSAFAPSSFSPASPATPGSALGATPAPAAEPDLESASPYQQTAAPAPAFEPSQEDTAEELGEGVDSFFDDEPKGAVQVEEEEDPKQPIQLTPGPQVNFGPNVSAPTPQATPQRVDDNFGLGEVTDQNYLTVLGRALDLIGWTDEQADSYSLKTFGVPHWDELGRSQAEKLVAHLIGLLKEQLG